MNKKINILALVILMLSLSITVYAEVAANIEIDKVKVVFTESSGMPFIDENSRTQVPLRVTMESYGTKVDWDDATKTAIVTKDNITVKVPMNEKYILINDVKKEIDTKSVNINSRIYLPIRFVLEAFGAKVDWDQATKTVIVKRPSSVKNDVYQE